MKWYNIVWGLAALAVTACTSESLKNSLVRQEQDIERYINTMKSKSNTVYNISGIYRIVLEIGEGEGAAAGDSVIFKYVAYTFSGGKGHAYDSSNVEKGMLGASRYFSGLETGLTGMQTNEHAQIIITGEKAYGNVDVGVVPPYSPLLFEIWMKRVVKQ